MILFQRDMTEKELLEYLPNKSLTLEIMVYNIFKCENNL
jgi:hypothetical protein